jgi:tetratricopeptide (TPR) repeat protein
LRLYEKILAVIIVIVLGLRCNPNISPDNQHLYTSLALFVASISYLIGGYWLFRKNTKKLKALSILSGIALCPSVYDLHLLLEIKMHENIEYFLLPNQLLFVSLGVVLLFKRKSLTEKSSIIGIFIRSAIVAVFTSFLYFIPETSAISRNVLSFFNKGDIKLQYNLKMAEYYEKSKTAYAMGDCESALQYAVASNKYGKLWLGIDTNVKSTPIDSVKYISGTYDYMFLAYKCRAENEFFNADFAKAIIDYSNASYGIYYGAYQSTGYDSNFYKDCNSWLEERIAVCYSKLRKYRTADSLFDKSIRVYRNLPAGNDSVLAEWLDEFALSVEEQYQYKLSTKLIGNALSILEKDSVKNRINIIQNYFYLAQSYMYQDSIDNALILLTRVLKELPENDRFYCPANSYYGLCLYKLDKYYQADSMLNKSLNCFKTIDSVNSAVAGIYCSLTLVKVSLGQFKNALDNIQNAVRLSLKISINGIVNPKYYEALAFVDEQMANYKEAEKNYTMLLSPAYAEESFSGFNQTGVKNELSHLYITTGKLNDAKTFSDQVLQNIGHSIKEGKLTYSPEINTLAYVRYCLGDYKGADTLYGDVIRTCNKWNRPNSSYMAIALNGLGLVKMSQSRTKSADSLFKASLSMHIRIFGKDNPYTALVYLNYGILKTSANAFSDAHAMLNSTLDIDNKFFDKSHDVFADVYFAMGNLFKKEKNKQQARNYFEQALNIYQNKFGKDYYKVLLTEAALKQL